MIWLYECIFPPISYSRSKIKKKSVTIGSLTWQAEIFIALYFTSSIFAHIMRLKKQFFGEILTVSLYAFDFSTRFFINKFVKPQSFCMTFRPLVELHESILIENQNMSSIFKSSFNVKQAKLIDFYVCLSWRIKVHFKFSILSKSSMII